MTFSQMQPGFFSSIDDFTEPEWDDAGNADNADDTRVSSYQAVLQEPTASLVGGTADRPDVATAAILGYN
ncbi:hypothetical protein WM22_15095 [Burkholderia ubonensis]|uniref:hypothetical protein n=1 Tax=Burkholderia ubonensis TaxID=101571 RepID=UPI00075D7EC2|nr:hypothetical protein [Burkholderia ubonensis]KWK95043.1 hypothetical protein WM19_00970 [Burkholderia ubonensis]KWK99694.1 hypothetical protein WM20_01095 [Burkholderia ubonensis]KWN36671.1 hypothetical protein WM22_15095 [Burkholderia ubonensis]ODQ29599.1 hypothetical protein BGV64_12850 [Burkholderia ubonensis]